MINLSWFYQKRMAYPLVLGVLLSLPFSAMPDSTHTNQLNALSRSLTDLQEKQQLDTAKRDKLNARLKDTDVSISNLHLSLNTLTVGMKKQSDKLQQLANEKKQLENAFKSQQQLLLKQLSINYQLGKHQYIKLILNQHDPMLTNRLLTYISYINQARAATLKKTLSLQKGIEEKESLSQLRLNTLEKLKSAQSEQEKTLKKQITFQNELILTLNQTLTSREAKIASIKADKIRLEKLLTQLSEQRALTKKQRPFPHMKHRLPWPLNGKLINQYGKSIDGVARHGAMFEAPEGRKISAVYQGKIVFADWLKGFGLLIILNHGHGYMTLYANNQTLFRKTGDEVQQGDVIASTGHTGGQLEDGLYFELRYKGKPINPSQWLVAKR